MEYKRKKNKVVNSKINQASTKKQAPETLLNHDCLVNIFSFLSINDRIRLERVCKRWYQASRASWSNLEELNPFKIDFDNCETHQSFKKIFEQVLLRCGKFIKKISSITDINLLRMILKMCPNLEEIDFVEIDINALKLFAKKKESKITSLTLTRPSRHCNDEFLENIFSKLNLKKFSIDETKYFTGSCLKNLTAENIQYISLYSCRNIDWLMTFKILQNFKNLQILALKGFNHRHSNAFIGALQKLNLKELYLYNNYRVVDDDFLIRLAPALKNLSKLDISQNIYLTDKGLSAVSQLTNLEYLNIDILPDVKGESLMNFPKLKCIDVSSSCTIEGKINILNSSDQLELMYVDQLITDKKFIAAAVKLANKPDRNKTFLTIKSFHVPQEFLQCVSRMKIQSPFLKFSEF